MQRANSKIGGSTVAPSASNALKKRQLGQKRCRSANQIDSDETENLKRVEDLSDLEIAQ